MNEETGAEHKHRLLLKLICSHREPVFISLFLLTNLTLNLHPQISEVNHDDEQHNTALGRARQQQTKFMFFLLLKSNSLALSAHCRLLKCYTEYRNECKVKVLRVKADMEQNETKSTRPTNEFVTMNEVTAPRVELTDLLRSTTVRSQS